MSQLQIVCCSGLWAVWLCAAEISAADDAVLTPQDTLPTVLNRIHEHAADKSWRAENWKDEQIEQWLEQLTTIIATGASTPWLTLPVRFADVKPTESTDLRTLDHARLVGRNFRLLSTKLRNCVVLADGNFLAESIEGCIVIARGAVSVTSSDSSVIVAGAYAETGGDGQVRNLENGSLFLTPGWASLDSLNGTVVLANEGVTTGRQVNGGIFVNATLVTDALSSPSQRRPRAVKIRDLPIGDLVNDPLSSQLSVTDIIYPEPLEVADPLSLTTSVNRNKPRPRPTGLLLRFQGRRYVVNIGQPIVDQHEQPIPALAGWKLSYVNDKLAIFSSGHSDAIVRLEDL